MKIITRKVETIEKDYILELFDHQIIIECLNYCYHRIKKHNKFVPEFLPQIQKLRAEFGIIDNKKTQHKKEALSTSSLKWESVPHM